MKYFLALLFTGFLIGFVLYRPKPTADIVVIEKLPCSSMTDSRCENYQPQMCYE